MTRSRLARRGLLAMVIGLVGGVIAASIDPFWLDGFHRFVGFEVDVALVVIGVVWVHRCYQRWRLGRSGESL